MLFLIGFVLGFIAGPFAVALLPERYDPFMRAAMWVASRRNENRSGRDEEG